MTVAAGIVRAAVFAAAATAVLPAQAAATQVPDATCRLAAAHAQVRFAGVATLRVEGPRPAPFSIPAGEVDVHFAPDAAGKPMSLRLQVPAGAAVAVATSPAAARERAEVEVASGVFEPVQFGAADSLWHARCSGDAAARDYRVSARVPGVAAGAAGVLARVGDGSHYRFVIDRTRGGGELRLERQLGAHVLVLLRAASPAAGDHDLALECDGFRLRAWCDDALVGEVLDGACEAGRFGVVASVVDAAWTTCASEPPAPLRASSALVATGTNATFVAATTAAGGHRYVLELVLDRPQPLRVRGPGGEEPAVLGVTGEPRVLLADWRGSLGAGVIGDVASGGGVRAELQWPAGAALAARVVLVCALLVSPDGSVVVDRTPAVPLRL